MLLGAQSFNGDSSSAFGSRRSTRHGTGLPVEYAHGDCIGRLQAFEGLRSVASGCRLVPVLACHRALVLLPVTMNHSATSEETAIELHKLAV